MSDKKTDPPRPYYIPPKKAEQDLIIRSVAEIVKQLGNAAPKIDHTCKVVKRDDN